MIAQGKPMNTRQKSHKKHCPVTVIGHRGAAGTAPENTIAAIKRAFALGADYIEIDVRLTKDKVPVVLHDAVFKGVLPTQAVREITYTETQRYDIGSWFDPAFASERIPTLAEVIAACSNKAPLMVEIKREAAGPKAIATAVFEVIKTMKSHWEHIVVGSFCQTILKFMKKQIDASTLPIELIGIVDEEHNIEHFLALGIKRLALSYHLITPELVKEMHRHKVTVWAYTVNSVETARELAHMGVNGIISDFPEKIKQL
jgi:glycerophosphoryl diester phosphodiesterase